ncbi:MAG: GFA family protein [Burkholderiales bacterium]|nr:GFA family protein [Pseudomonadota bacterium]
MTAICHCRNCQLQTGIAFSVLVAIPKGALTMEGAQPVTFETQGDSGLPVLRSFCSKCGSPIFSEVAATPTMDGSRPALWTTLPGFSLKSTYGATQRSPGFK